MYVCVREKRIGVATKNRQWGESFLKEHFFYEASFSQLSLGSITCALTSFFFELSHVIYLKLTRVIQECLLSLNELNDFFLQFYKKKTIWHLEIWQN